MRRNRRHTHLRLIVFIVCNDDMTIESRNFLAYLLLQADSCRDRNNHHDHSDSNCRNRNFYNWRRNTTFTAFSSNKSFGDKIF